MKAKSIFTFYMKMYDKELKASEKLCAVLVSQLPALVKLENETGVKFTPSGLENNAFGMAYISKHAKRIFTFAECKKHLLWLKSVGGL